MNQSKKVTPALTLSDIFEKAVGYYHNSLIFDDAKKSEISKLLYDAQDIERYSLGIVTTSLEDMFASSPDVLSLLEKSGCLGIPCLDNHLVCPYKDSEGTVIAIEALDIKTGNTCALPPEHTVSVVKQFLNISHATTAMESETPIPLDDFETFVRNTYDVKHRDAKEGRLSVTLMVKDSHKARFALDTVNLYSDKQRKSFIQQVQLLEGHQGRDIESELFCLIRLLEKETDLLLKPSQDIVIGEKEKAEALEILRSPSLFDTVAEDIESLGYIGETLNKQLAYVVMTSRQTQHPLSLILMSTSAAGKSSLQKTILDLCPPENRKHYTRLTAQSLYYLGEDSLKHTFLSIEEDEGSQEASYALKILLSAKSIHVANAGSVSATGKRQSTVTTAKGPVSVMVSTTKSEIEPELASRAMSITIDETPAQTRKIQERQRFSRSLQGQLVRKSDTSIQNRHHTMQRLLNPKLKIINNMSDGLTFPCDRLKYRRGHEHYLNLIDAIAYLRQFQKTVVEHPDIGPYIEVDDADIEWANKLFQPTMEWYGTDLKPNTKRLLVHLQAYAEEKGTTSFTRKDIREVYKWEHASLHRHLSRLCELDYVRLKAGSNGVKHVYELLELG
jgi:hypothetical protein